MIGILALVLSSGCYRIEYYNTEAAMGPMGSPEVVWHHRAVNGLVELEGPVEIREVCPGDFSRIRTEVSVTNALVTWGVAVLVPLGFFNVYTPSTVEVDCVYLR